MFIQNIHFKLHLKFILQSFYEDLNIFKKLKDCLREMLLAFHNIVKKTTEFSKKLTTSTCIYIIELF